MLVHGYFFHNEPTIKCSHVTYHTHRVHTGHGNLEKYVDNGFIWKYVGFKKIIKTWNFVKKCFFKYRGHYIFATKENLKVHKSQKLLLS